MAIKTEHNALMVFLTSYPQIVILAPFQFPYWITRNHIALPILAATFHSKILCIQRFIHCNIKSSSESHCFLGHSPSSYKSSNFSLFLTVWPLLTRMHCKWSVQDDTLALRDSASNAFLPPAILLGAKLLRPVCNMSFVGLPLIFCYLM